MKHGQIDPLALDPEYSADLHLLGGDHKNQEVSGWEGPAEHFSRACTELGTAPSMGDSPNKAWMVCPCPQSQALSGGGEGDKGLDFGKWVRLFLCY